MYRPLLLLLTTAAGLEAAPDLILHHGRVLTLDPQSRIAEAVAIENGRITAVGTNEEVLALGSATTQRLDLGGRTLMPGLMDSHVHPGAAMTEFDHELPDMHRIADVLAYFKARAAVSEPGDLLSLRQVFITRLEEKRYPTRAELDEAAPANPVVFSTGPDSMLNSLALKLAGIDRNFRLPEGHPGKIETDANGEPTGLLRGYSPGIKAPVKRRNPTEEDTYRRTLELFHDYAAVGLTTVADRGASASAMKLYQKMRDTGELPVRLRLSASFSPLGLWPATERAIDEILQHPLTRPDPQLQIIGTKVFLDGGMLTGSAFMGLPWGVSDAYGIRDPDYRGEQKIPAERLRQLVAKIAGAGLQFTAHSVGDGAVRLLVDTYEEVNRDFPIRDSRSCITHCNFMSPESIAKAAKLGVCVDLQPIWLHLDGRTLTHHFGEERMALFQPLRTCFEQGLVVGGGSDHMQKIGSLRSINPYNPWLGLWTAVSRKARGLEQPVHAEHAITREQALRLYTTNNAWLLKLEKDTGAIEPGKFADLILLDRDPLLCPLDDLPHTQVLKTWLGGKIVHAAK
jgi:predicted amidohydrolase YtcJ